MEQNVCKTSFKVVNKKGMSTREIFRSTAAENVKLYTPFYGYISPHRVVLVYENVPFGTKINFCYDKK